MENESPANPMWNEYDELPEAIKVSVSFVGYKWLSDDEKNRLIQTETEPEWDE